jgi:hypothetical protein
MGDNLNMECFTHVYGYIPDLNPFFTGYKNLNYFELTKFESRHFEFIGHLIFLKKIFFYDIQDKF